MEQKKTIFLADANTFITPYKEYYSFDLAPKFWRDLEEEIIAGRIAILDKVYDELYAGGDNLSDWLSNISPLNKITFKNSDIFAVYSEILAHIQTSGLYTSKALAEWSGNRVADPWLVACAKINNFIIVTYTNLYDMMRALSISVSK